MPLRRRSVPGLSSGVAVAARSFGCAGVIALPITRQGIAEHHLPAVEDHDQADEAHGRKLPRQPLVRQIPR